jgi:hypothetical protein
LYFIIASSQENFQMLFSEFFSSGTLAKVKGTLNG